MRITEINAFLDPRAVAVGETLHVVALRSISTYYLKSIDNGLSWTDPISPTEIFYGSSEMPDILYSNDLLHLVWVGQIEGNYRYQLFHFSSSDGGVSWGERHQVYNNSGYGLKTPRIVATGDTLFLTCRIGNELLALRSLDNGQSWVDSIVIESGPLNIDGPPNILFSQGRVHLVYQMNVIGDSLGIEIYHRYSDDYGLSWSDRIPLSTLEYDPYVTHGQFPSAYADENGNIITLWFDYKYGSECGYSGDILGRISNDNGNTWLRETRLTFSQTGSGSSCTILNDNLYAVWMDEHPYGCNRPKIMYSESLDWGITWENPIVISGSTELGEYAPVLFYSIASDDSIFHCVFERNGDLFYTRDQENTPVNEMEGTFSAAEIPFTAYPNPFNSSIKMSFSNPKGGDIEIGIFNLLGQRIKTFKALPKEGKIIWDARDALGNKVSTGIYFARAKNNKNSVAIKLLYMK